MDKQRILLIQGHPDAGRRHLCHALEDAYAAGAAAAGHEVRRINVAALDFPLLHSQDEWEKGSLPPGLTEAQAAIKWCGHMVLFFPMWLGEMPALLKGFLEQIARPGFAFSYAANKRWPAKGLTGRSARVVVTMGMPAVVYRWYFRAHSLKSLKRNILAFVGIAPVRETLIGMAGGMKPETAKKWFAMLEKIGGKGD